MKKILLIPLTAQPYNFCSKSPRGLKFVMRIDPPHAGPTTTFLFFNSTKIVHLLTFSARSFLTRGRPFSLITIIDSEADHFCSRCPTDGNVFCVFAPSFWTDYQKFV